MNFLIFQPDIERIFDSIALELDPKIQDFHKKNNYALSRLRKLSSIISNVVLPEDMDAEKAKFCSAKAKELNETDFSEIYNHLMEGSQKAIMTFKKIHLSFYCMLCDYRAHNEFNLEGSYQFHLILRTKSNL